MNVLYTVNGLRVNGMSAVIMQYISCLSKENYHFSIFTDEIADQFMEQLRNNHVEIIQSHNRRKNQLAYYMELCSILRGKHFDILHAHGNSATLAVEMLAAKNCGVPVRIAHSHNTTCVHKTFDRLLRPLFYSTYTHGIGCGEEAGRWLFRNHKHEVIKNGIALNHFAYNEQNRNLVRQKLQLQGKYVIGHVGRFTDQKNHDFIVNVFKEFLNQKDAILLLVGNGPKEIEIRQLVQKEKLDEKVIFYGTVKDAAPLYSAMDVFLFPSKFEGVPLTLLEAQANGLPCVISDRISAEVNLTDLVSVVSLADVKPWIKKLYVPACDREKRSEEAIKQLTRAGYEINDVICQIDTLYKNAVANSRKRKENK